LADGGGTEGIMAAYPKWWDSTVILCHQVCDEGLWWSPKTALHLNMKKHHPKKQRRFHVGQRSQLDDGVGSS